MRVRESDNLFGIGRVSQYFLVAGHGCVKHNLACRVPFSTDSDSPKNTTVLKGKNGWYSQANLLDGQRVYPRKRGNPVYDGLLFSGRILQKSEMKNFPHLAFINSFAA
jgi:hypothetical protein